MIDDAPSYGTAIPGNESGESANTPRDSKHGTMNMKR
ncbi:hypothetical protein PR003_g28414 [Phytophthora rubi]|uniref:Uncharacterized protein n=1 Tax=Phytophthora rubi TaxID=129364 RepID=A0A6A4BVR3_9STRA|nr:hypothetical protein PR003_g28414 [Phytophthora rubi]